MTANEWMGAWQGRGCVAGCRTQRRTTVIVEVTVSLNSNSLPRACVFSFRRILRTSNFFFAPRDESKYLCDRWHVQVSCLTCKQLLLQPNPPLPLLTKHRSANENVRHTNKRVEKDTAPAGRD